ncbi:calcium/sodium antiporter [Nitrospira defluvii]|nr:calcium/sodium antiporter [Nitrospira defluvii]
MLIELSYTFIGFILLILGAGLTVSGAAELATRWGIRPMVVGLTVVALGTSAPEFAASLSASLSGRGDIAIGNVIGSNISNIGLALGLASLIRPLKVQPRLVRFEVPLLIVVSAIVYLFAFMGKIPRGFGLVLFSGLIVYIIMLYRWSLKDRPEIEAEFVPKADDRKSPFINVMKVVVGLSFLAGGGYLLVEGAVGLARWAGVSELVIGLTIVAIGTSIPEVVTSIVAVCRGQVDIAIGNVLGSNIFNILGVLGAAAMVQPIGIQDALIVRDFPVMGLLTLLLFPFFRMGFDLKRREGIFFLMIYLAYIGGLAFSES